MNKFIHCADIHLDSLFKQIDDEKKIEVLKYEQKSSFEMMFEYAQKEKINLILIAGDLIDSECLSLKTLNYINDIFKKYSQINVVFVLGNHDEKVSIFLNYQFNENFHLIDSKKMYELENIRIYNNFENIELDNDFYNILMWHGDVSANLYKIGYNSLPLNALRDLKFNYLALGHVHKFMDLSNPQTKIVYSGCLKGTGFDECGTKGFVVVDINQNSFELIDLKLRKFMTLEVDVTSLNAFQIEEKISKLIEDKNDLYKIVLQGKVSEFIDAFSITNKFQGQCFYIKVIDKTDLKEDNLLQNSFKERFVSLLDKKISNAASNEERERLINIKKVGLMAINGEVKIYDN